MLQRVQVGALGRLRDSNDIAATIQRSEAHFSGMFGVNVLLDKPRLGKPGARLAWRNDNAVSGDAAIKGGVRVVLGEQEVFPCHDGKRRRPRRCESSWGT